jgi:teichuronic acid biosynthesis glycosyltransferase TuaC
MKHNIENILFIANSFPSIEHPAKSPFNYNLVKQLGCFANVQVFVFKTIGLRKLKPKSYQYDNINVKEIYLPTVPCGTTKIPFSSTKWMQQFSFYVALVIVHLMQYDKYDVIHSVGLGLNTVLGSLIAKKTNSKFFVQLIGSDVDIHLKTYKNMYRFKQAIKSVAGVLSNSYSLAATFKQAGFIQNKISVIYRGVNQNLFTPHSFDFFEKKQKIIFLYLGGLVKTNAFKDGNVKGGITLLNAWIKNEEKFVKNGAYLHFGGPNFGGFVLENFIRKLQYPKHFKYIGEIKPMDVPDVMKMATSVVIPSLTEGLPNVCMEAMSAGKAVVATEVGGIPEILTHKKTGLLIKPADEQALADAMFQLIQNQELRLNCMKNAVEFAREHLNGNLYGNAVLDFYLSCECLIEN